MVAKINLLSRLTPLLFVFAPFLAQSNMTVYPMAVSINSQGEGNVRVISKSNEVQYIKATVFRIDNPSTPQENEVEIKSGDANHLVVMPPKFALPAGSSKTVRFVAMEPEQKEKNYRVKFEAVPSIDDVATDKKDLSMQLTVNLIWGIVVSVPPQQPIAKLEVNAAQKLVNAGNQRLKILTIAYCKNNSKENCKIQTVNKTSSLVRKEILKAYLATTKSLSNIITGSPKIMASLNWRSINYHCNKRRNSNEKGICKISSGRSDVFCCRLRIGSTKGYYCNGQR